MSQWLIGILASGGLLALIWRYLVSRRIALDNAHESGRARGRAELASELEEKASLATRERQLEIDEQVAAIQDRGRQRRAGLLEESEGNHALVEHDPYEAVRILGEALDDRESD